MQPYWGPGSTPAKMRYAYFHPHPYPMPMYMPAKQDCLSRAQVDYMNHMRLLWEQHVAWTRMAISSIVFDLPDTDEVLARLLQNAPDMGEALKPFYGEAAAQTYSNLIKDHLVIAADLVKAAKAGDQQAAAAAEKKWYANADQIIEFLSALNPYFPKERFRTMFHAHLKLTKAEAVALLNKDYKLSIQLYDRIERDALVMADIISSSIINQFPQMF